MHADEADDEERMVGLPNELGHRVDEGVGSECDTDNVH
jgi:hypothetical protein